ncbi:MAG: hypothetical protein NC920_00565 [Candidatus Omnitrophica bacterium]|nr:hypothetical protein [Candidatus Omnitrophota bacterium]
MKKNLIKKLIFILFIGEWGLLNFFLLDFPSLRRIRRLSLELIPDPYLAEPVTVEFVTTIKSRIERIEAFAIKYAEGTSLSSDTWEIGLTLAILRNIEDLALKDLEIKKWIEKNYSFLKQYFPQLDELEKIPQSAEPFEDLRKIFAAIEGKESYSAIESSLINLYFEEFIQRSIQPQLLRIEPAETRQDTLLKTTLFLHRFRNPPPGINRNLVIPPDYLPDLKKISTIYFEDKTTQKGNYKKIVNDYLLNKLIHFELEGYGNRFLRGTKYVTQIQGLSEDQIKELIKEDLKRFVEENYPIVRRIVWSAFNYRYYADYDAATRSVLPLHFTLTITEAEYLVRKIISAYLKRVEDLYKPGETIFDPHLSENKEKSRLAYEDWAKVLEKIKDMERVIGPSQPLRLQRAIFYYLIKKLATAGAYDLSIQEIREKFQDIGEIPETETLREYRFVLSSFNKLDKEVLNNQKEKTKLVIFADNHGEFIYLLGFMQYALQTNPNLTIYLVTRRVPVADDVYKDSAWRILDYDKNNQNYFAFLREKANRERFYIISDGPDLQGEDFRSLSGGEFNVLTSKKTGQTEFDKIVVLSIGNANFVSTQGLKLERFYLYRVKTEKVSAATGIPSKSPEYGEFPLILAYLPAEICIGTEFGSLRYSDMLTYAKSHPQFYDPPLGRYPYP